MKNPALRTEIDHLIGSESATAASAYLARLWHAVQAGLAAEGRPLWEKSLSATPHDARGDRKVPVPSSLPLGRCRLALGQHPWAAARGLLAQSGRPEDPRVGH
jgi:hypothetical protein